VTGTVRKVDDRTGRIVIEGQTFVMQQSGPLALEPQVGHKVTLFYQERNGQKVITRIGQAQQAEQLRSGRASAPVARGSSSTPGLPPAAGYRGQAQPIVMLVSLSSPRFTKVYPTSFGSAGRALYIESVFGPDARTCRTRDWR
jgi:hypothetical protein